MTLRYPLAILVTCALSVTLAIAPASAATDWEPTPLTGRVVELIAPASGAFFARTPDGLFRSDDGGSSWRQVNTPPGFHRVAVDPLDHTVMYVGANDGISKTTDDAATWTLVLPDTGRRAINVAVSPADRNLVYVALAGRNSISSDFWMVRSSDGGATWEPLEEHHNSLCGWGAPILAPHPADSARVFRAASCYAGRSVTFGEILNQSVDRGATWSKAFHVLPRFPTNVVGGYGAVPTRFYLAVHTGREPTTWVYRSDDDGGSWSQMLEQPGAQVGGLTFDPSQPDRVYLGLTTGGVSASPDGGQTWIDLGRQDLARINDLAMGIDGQNLYAATDQGLLRLGLAP